MPAVGGTTKLALQPLVPEVQLAAKTPLQSGVLMVIGLPVQLISPDEAAVMVVKGRVGLGTRVRMILPEQVDGSGAAGTPKPKEARPALNPPPERVMPQAALLPVTVTKAGGSMEEVVFEQVPLVNG